jgi:hypothetical protein
VTLIVASGHLIGRYVWKTVDGQAMALLGCPGLTLVYVRQVDENVMDGPRPRGAVLLLAQGIRTSGVKSGIALGVNGLLRIAGDDLGSKVVQELPGIGGPDDGRSNGGPVYSGSV